MNVLTDHLTHIDIFTWINEELATVLQFVNSIGKGIAGVHRNHRTVDATLYLAFIRLILLEAVSHDGLTLGGCQHIGAQTDDTT